MTGAETLGTAFETRPAFRGPLEGQQPRVVGVNGLDVWLVLAVLGLVAIGAITVLNVGYFQARDTYGDGYHFLRKHLASIALGAVGCAAISQLRLRWLRGLAYPVLVAAIVSLVAVLVFGSEHGGAKRWIDLGPMAIQPSEFAKLAFTLYLAHSLVRKAPRIHEFGVGIVPHGIVAGVVIGLLVPERDFGSIVLILTILMTMLYGGGARARHLVVMVLAALALLVVAVLIEPYRIQRILSFWYGGDPQDSGYHLRQSLMAFGSGGLTGVGLGASQQKMFFLPAAHTDFIFAVIGEELGLVGAMAVLALFGVIGVRGFRIAARHTDEFGGLLAFGVTVLVLVQAALNVAVVLGCLPTKGLVLPFISYGGSAMLVALAEVGVLLALAREVG